MYYTKTDTNLNTRIMETELTVAQQILKDALDDMIKIYNNTLGSGINFLEVSEFEEYCRSQGAIK